MDGERYVAFFTGSEDPRNEFEGIRTKIRAKLYHLRETGIEVQQDGATPHMGQFEARINDILSAGNWNCRLINQSAQSPDLNIMDLGLFHSMKVDADAIKGDGRSLAKIVDRVERCYAAYPSYKIAINFGVLHEIYRLVLESDGDNAYKIPHSRVRAHGRIDNNYVNFNVLR